jgi:hypothetical protein
MNVIDKIGEERILILVTLVVGVIVGGALVWCYELIVPSHNLVSAPIIRDRVKSVIVGWSGRNPPIQDKEDLETIWASTRQSHDFDFQPGGADELCKMLDKEFTNPPIKPVSLQPSAFGPKGKLLTVDDLVQRVEAF